MIEEGHAASDRLAQHFGFVRYGRQESEGAPPIILYERRP
jgi:L-amino acid N-acyltransferase YncA